MNKEERMINRDKIVIVGLIILMALLIGIKLRQESFISLDEYIWQEENWIAKTPMEVFFLIKKRISLGDGFFSNME